MERRCTAIPFGVPCLRGSGGLGGAWSGFSRAAWRSEVSLHDAAFLGADDLDHARVVDDDLDGAVAKPLRRGGHGIGELGRVEGLSMEGILDVRARGRCAHDSRSLTYAHPVVKSLCLLLRIVARRVQGAFACPLVHSGFSPSP